MACVTLKRPLDVLGSPHMMEQEPVAKKRCGVSLFPTTPPSSGSSSTVGLRGTLSCERGSTISQRHKLCNSPVSTVRGSKRAKRRLDIEDQDRIPPTPLLVSPFESATPPLQTGKLVAQLEQELKRLHRRKPLVPGELAQSSPLPTSSPVNSHSSTNVKDQPLFTLRQVTIVCKRMLKERDELVRSEYDKVLTTKLAEQYDTFVKFSHDQIERRLAESAFSYVS